MVFLHMYTHVTFLSHYIYYSIMHVFKVRTVCVESVDSTEDASLSSPPPPSLPRLSLSLE